MSCRTLTFVFCLIAVPSLAADSATSLDELLTDLEASSESARLDATDKLAKLGKDAREAIPALVHALDDPSAYVRVAAVVALGEIGIDDDAVIAALLPRLDDVALNYDDIPLWAFAAQALGKLGPKSTPQLIEKLSADNRTGRRAAAIALHGIRPKQTQAIPALIAMLKQDEQKTRIAAMYAIIAIAPRQAATAMPTLQHMLHSDDLHTQYWSCRTIAAIGAPEALEAVPQLLTLTATGVASVRSNAADAIGIIGAEVGDRAIAPLTKMLKDGTHPVRRAGVIALGRLGSLALPSAPAIEVAMRDQSRSIRAEAAAALWQVTGEHEASLPVLIEVVQERNAPWEAAHAFERLGALGEPAVAELSKLVATTTGETQYFAISSLAGIGPAAKDAIPTLTKLAEGSDDEMRQLVEDVIKRLSAE